MPATIRRIGIANGKAALEASRHRARVEPERGLNRTARVGWRRDDRLFLLPMASPRLQCGRGGILARLGSKRRWRAARAVERRCRRDGRSPQSRRFAGTASRSDDIAMLALRRAEVTGVNRRQVLARLAAGARGPGWRARRQRSSRVGMARPNLAEYRIGAKEALHRRLARTSAGMWGAIAPARCANGRFHTRARSECNRAPHPSRVAQAAMSASSAPMRYSRGWARAFRHGRPLPCARAPSRATRRRGRSRARTCRRSPGHLGPAQCQHRDVGGPRGGPARANAATAGCDRLDDSGARRRGARQRASSRASPNASRPH